MIAIADIRLTRSSELSVPREWIEVLKRTILHVGPIGVIDVIEVIGAIELTGLSALIELKQIGETDSIELSVAIVGTESERDRSAQNRVPRVIVVHAKPSAPSIAFGEKELHLEVELRRQRMAFRFQMHQIRNLGLMET
jgi:hypothetical protein